MGPGNFSFITDSMEREALTHDYHVIENIGEEAWNALKKHDPNQSFMWDTSGTIWTTIREKMWYGHSGASSSISLRILEYIAKNGWEQYMLNQKN